MRSFQKKADGRRSVFLALSGSVEGQIREAYNKLFSAGKTNQSSLAKDLNVGRSVIYRRLNGHTNMTLETVADMVWALGCQIEVKISDASESGLRNSQVSQAAGSSLPPATLPSGTSAQPVSNTLDLVGGNALNRASAIAA